MLDAGYTPREAFAVLRAMFGPQAPEAMLAAWRVFDPTGRGYLTLREAQAAFALFGQKVMSHAQVQAEFESIDEDGSGSIELKEFGQLMRRLASLAQGDAPATRSGPDASLMGRARQEMRLLRLLDAELTRMIPMGYHGLARRLMMNMRAIGFLEHDVPPAATRTAAVWAPAPPPFRTRSRLRVALVLRALFVAPNGRKREAFTVAQAWLLLGAVDWTRAKVLSHEEQESADLDDALGGVHAADADADADAAAPRDERSPSLARRSRSPVAVRRMNRQMQGARQRGRVPHKPSFNLDDTLGVGDFERLVG
eukprot:3293938-Prymnesium_polylepis.1